MSKFDKKIRDICKGMGGEIVKLKNKEAVKKVKDMQKKDANFGGVYVLWEKGGDEEVCEPIYVGRASNIGRRIINNHRAANMSTSSFASHLTREKVGKHARRNKDKDKTQNRPVDYMISSFNNDETLEGTTSTEVKKYIETHELKDIIKSEVKDRIEKMYFTFVKEENYLKQILLEIFCMDALDTMTKETKLVKNINRTTFSYKKYNFS